MQKLIYRKNLSEQKWDGYLKEVPNGTFEYTYLSIEYRKEYSRFIIEDLSFVLQKDGMVVCVCPMFLERVNGINQISNAGGYGVCPLINSNMRLTNQESLIKEIFGIVDGVAEKNSVKKIMFRFDPLVNPDMTKKLYNYNFLMRNGYENTSIHSQVIDLRLGEKERWSDVRKGHKSDINRGNREYSFEVYDQNNVNLKVFEIYKEMHHAAAGRITRTAQTFALMHDWIKAGHGCIGLVKYNNSYVGVILVSYFNGTAYYASGAETPDFKTPVAIGHMLQWNMMNYLKEKGIKQYEIGWQQFGSQQYDKPTEKDVTISKFKRGFGGYTVPLFRGIKYL